MQKPDDATIPPTAARATAPQAWPQTLPEQLAARFTGKGHWKSRLPDIFAALEALGRARRMEDGRWMG